MASVENESEILLGNKQLLAVFAVVTILLATAFTGGYMLGKSSAEKKPGTADAAQSSGASVESNGGPITQKITPEEPPTVAKNEPTPTPIAPAPETAPPPKVEHKPSVPRETSEKVLGQRSPAVGGPAPGESYVQVMAVSRKEAEATADVLRQHDFKARIAPAPNNSAIFRVLVGPGKDTADLRNTEDALRKIGYTKCFVQHY